MSDLKNIGALLSRSALPHVVRTGIARLDIGGVRLLPFRVALGLLMCSVRRSAVQPGSPKGVQRQSEPSRRRPSRAGRVTKGGIHHG